MKANFKMRILISVIIVTVGCAAPKEDTLQLTANISDSVIHQIFKSKVYLGLAMLANDNRYHSYIHMFNEEGVNFFPVYSSKQKLDELYSKGMIMPDFKPFDGVLFSSTMNDSMLYVVNYLLPDQLVLSGQKIKEVMKDDILRFKEENKDLLLNDH